MARRNISLPDDLDAAARDSGLNVSALTRQAIVAELDRRARMERLDAWLDELDAEHGPPSSEAIAAAEAWADAARPVVAAAAGKAARRPAKAAAPPRAAKVAPAVRRPGTRR